MKIESVHIKDFLSIGDIELDFTNYRNGLLVVLGDNRDSDSQDSNGAGKSSIVEAVVWCLYGRTLRSCAAADVVRRGAKSCSVEITLSGNHTIRRERSGKSAPKGYVDGKSVGSDVLTHWVSQNIGLRFREFVAANIFSQSGTIIPFARMTDREKKNVVEELREMTEFESARECASRICKDAQVRSGAHIANISNLKSLLDDLEKSSADTIRSVKENISSVRETLVSTKQQIKEHNEMASESSETLKECERELAEWKDVRNELAKKQEEIVYKLGEDKAKAAEELAIYKQKLNYAKRNVKEVRSLIDSGKCPTCETPLTHGSPAKRVASKLDKARKDVGELTTEVDQYQSAVATAEQLLSASKATLTDIKNEPPPAELLKKVEEAKRVLRDITEKMTDLEKNKAAASASLSQLEKQLESIEHKSSSGEIVAVRESIEDFTAAAEYLTEVSKKAGIVRDALSTKGVRSWLMDAVCSKISTYATEYLRRAIGHGCYINILQENDRFVVSSVLTPGGVASSSQSGGELRLQDVCLQLALRKYLCHDIISIDSCGIVVFDDVFDVLDPVAANEVLQVLVHYANESGDCVVVLTPDDVGTGQDTIVVVKEDGVSRLG